MIDRDTVIALAEKHATCTSSQHKEFLHDGLIAFVSEISQMAAEAERAAIDKMHDEEDLWAPIGHSSWGEGYQEGWGEGIKAYVEAIRARGTGGEG